LFSSIFRSILGKLKKISKSDLLNYEHEKLSLLEAKLEMSFGRTEYYIKALTHRSFLELSPDFEKSNERLEFLGDAVLGLVTAETLFKKYPNKHEGFLTKYRSHLVDKESLFSAAQKLNLINYVLYDKRYVRGSDEGKKTIVADCMEALIGAIYLDKGLESAADFIHEWIVDPNFESGHVKVDKNHKGKLLEYTHLHKLPNPRYKIISEEGPDHNKQFIVHVYLSDEQWGSGEGKNKKSAEQEAAKDLLEKISN
jgi:ribonuclease-3